MRSKEEGKIPADGQLVSEDGDEPQSQIAEVYPRQPSFSPDELRALLALISDP